MLLCNTCERNEDEVKIIKKKMICQSCNSKVWYENNKEKVKENNKVYYKNNKENIKELFKEYYEKNKENKREENKNYREKNKEIFQLRNRKYYENNKEMLLNDKKKYYENNKEKISDKNKKSYRNNIVVRKEYRRIYERYKLDNDYFFRLKHYIRSMIRNSLNNGYNKKGKTQEILGCSFEDLKEHLESKFEPWMNWNNKGLYNGELNYGWDIDHIIPLSSAITEEEIIKLNHYTNLQPLCSYTNRYIKRDTIK
jgi:hypothetical protein